MRFARLLAAPALAALPLTACISPQLSDFQDVERQFRLEEYFVGKTTAYGIFEDRFGKLRREFKVEITGTLEGKTLILDEAFEYADGETDRRVWTIEVLGNGQYRGTANDVPGVAVGEAVGNAFNWKYKVDLPVNGSVWNVGFDDWMYLQPDGVLMNRAYVTRYGIEIGQVTITFLKTS